MCNTADLGPESNNETSSAKIIDFCAAKAQRQSEVIPEEQQSFAAHVARGTRYREAGDYNQAVLEFAAAYNICDSDVQLCLDLGTTLGEEGHFDKAAFYLKRAAELDPDNADTFFYLGMVYMNCNPKHYRHAIAAFQACLRCDPHMPQVSVYIAECWLALGKSQQATEIIEEYLNMHGTDTEALNLLAVLHLGSGDSEQAVQTLRNAIRHTPSDPILYENLGIAYMYRGFIDMSILNFEKACKLDSNDANNFYNLAYALSWRGDLQEALVPLRRALAIDKDNVLYQLLQGNILMEQGEFDEALQSLRVTQKHFPDHPTACGMLGICYVRRNECSQAIPWLERARHLDEHNPEWPFHLAVCNLLSNDLEEAAKSIDQAITINDQIAGYHVLRGDICYLRGKTARAQTCWQEALALDENLRPDIEERLAGHIPDNPTVN